MKKWTQNWTTPLRVLLAGAGTLPAGWELNADYMNCGDNNGGYNGNNGENFKVVGTNTLTIAASRVRYFSDLACTVSVKLSAPTLRVSKALGIAGRLHSSDQFVVQIKNSANTPVGSTANSAGDGSFSLNLAGVPANQAVCVVQTVPAGFTPVSVNAGTTTGATTTTTASSTVLKFTPAASTAYSGIILGNVPLSTLTSDGSQQTGPGQTVLFAHIYTTGSAGNVTFSTASTNSPANSSWSSTLYQDVDCNGTLDAGDALFSAAVTVAAGQRVCVINRIFAPSGLANGSQDTTTLSATETWSTPALSAASQTQVLKNTDTTTISASGLKLVKEVRQLSSCPANATASQANITSEYKAAGSAKPGDALEYRLRYSNNTASPINSVKLYDAVPAYTSFVSAYCLVTPTQGITGCTVTQQPGSGSSTGSITWTMSDATGNVIGLQPAASGSVGFCVTVQSN